MERETQQVPNTNDWHNETRQEKAHSKGKCCDGTMIASVKPPFRLVARAVLSDEPSHESLNSYETLRLTETTLEPRDFGLPRQYGKAGSWPVESSLSSTRRVFE
jgi:hypothetical protein